jgi:hypothetical protein
MIALLAAPEGPVAKLGGGPVEDEKADTPSACVPERKKTVSLAPAYGVQPLAAERKDEPEAQVAHAPEPP